MANTAPASASHPGDAEDIASPTSLQIAAREWAKAGWKILSMTDEQFVATRKEPPSILLILIGLFLTPGLIGLPLLLWAFTSRTEDMRVVTVPDAESWLSQRQSAHQRLARYGEEALARQEARLASATGLYGIWLEVPETLRIFIVLVPILTAVFVLTMACLILAGG